jgi:hypothetical protein
MVPAVELALMAGRALAREELQIFDSQVLGIYRHG